jgi:hypothetical protein
MPCILPIPFVDHLYTVYSLKNNSWRFDYWLAHCLDWKKTLFELAIDDEDNDFLMGSMVIKGEYLTPDTQQKKKDD